MDIVELSQEKWLETFYELTKKDPTYLKIEFQFGRVIAKLSSALVRDRTILVLQRQSTLDDPDAIELIASLPEPLLGRYVKRTAGTTGVCLSIFYKHQWQWRGWIEVQELESLHLSNERDFLTS